MPIFAAALLFLSAVLVLSVGLELAALGFGVAALMAITAGLGVLGVVAASFYLATSAGEARTYDSFEHDNRRGG